jgi:hypothetical protein
MTTLDSGWSSGNTSTRQQKLSSMEGSKGVESFGEERRSFREEEMDREPIKGELGQIREIGENIGI